MAPAGLCMADGVVSGWGADRQIRMEPLFVPSGGSSRAFGATIGRGVTMRPGLKVKLPWKLSVGDFSMIGEDVWIDNLHSRGDWRQCVLLAGLPYLCTGNHDWSSPTFAYRLAEISINEGAWIGARAFVGPGVTVGDCGIVTAGSVCTRSVNPFKVVVGNPAEEKCTRVLKVGEVPHSTGRKARMRW